MQIKTATSPRFSRPGKSAPQRQKNCPETVQNFSYCYRTTDKRYTVTKVKCKCDESNKQLFYECALDMPEDGQRGV